MRAVSAKTLRLTAVAAVGWLTRVRAECGATLKQLTWECGGLCGDGTPCVVYDAAADCSGCQADDSDECQYQCFPGVYNAKREFSYQIPSNSSVSSVATIGLPSDVNHAFLRGGSRLSGGKRGSAARVDLASDLLSLETQLTWIWLYRLDLHSTIDVIPSMLPPTVTRLTLENDGIMDFDVDVASSFPRLQQLELPNNDIVSITTYTSSSTLTELDLGDNIVSYFDAQLPALVYLNLANNSLASIPTSVYDMQSLRTLSLAGNPLVNRTVTDKQANFLANLTLDLTDADFAEASCGELSARQLRSDLALCISGTIANESTETPTPAPTSTLTLLSPTLTPTSTPILTSTPTVSESTTYTSSSGVSGSNDTSMIVGLACGGAVLVIALVGVLIWCRHRHSDENDDKLITTMSSVALLDSVPRLGRSGLWRDKELCFLRINSEDIRDIREIGRGANGVVWLVKYQYSELLASKRLVRGTDQNREEDRDRLHAFVKEIKLVAVLEHPNIVRFVGAAWKYHHDLQALFEYMELGDLREHLVATATTRVGVWDVPKVQMALDVAAALVYVHSFVPPVVHRDVKSKNVLLTAADGETQAKLTDFGTARNQSEQATMTEAVGTGRWIAPEVLVGILDYGPSADVFSFGVLLSELDTHAIPYDDVHVRSSQTDGASMCDFALLEMIMTGKLRPSFHPKCPAEIRKLAGRCMAQDPSERPTAVEVHFELRSFRSKILG